MADSSRCPRENHIHTDAPIVNYMYTQPSLFGVRINESSTVLYHSRHTLFKRIAVQIMIAIRLRFKLYNL